jgi:hypothetical protein
MIINLGNLKRPLMDHKFREVFPAGARRMPRRFSTHFCTWLRTWKASVIGSYGFEITTCAPSDMKRLTSRACGWLVERADDRQLV